METLVNILNKLFCLGTHLSSEHDGLLGAEKSACHLVLAKEKNWLNWYQPLYLAALLSLSATDGAHKNLMYLTVSYLLTLQSINTKGKKQTGDVTDKESPIYKAASSLQQGAPVPCHHSGCHVTSQPSHLSKRLSRDGASYLVPFTLIQQRITNQDLHPRATEAKQKTLTCLRSTIHQYDQ